MRRLLMLALLCTAPLLVGPASSAVSDVSPNGRTASLQSKVRSIERRVRDLEAKVDLMRQTAERYEDWEACISMVPVSEYGDPDRQFGYVYDDRDGTAGGYMPALAIDKSRPRNPQYMFLEFARSGDCRSDAPQPGGTAEPAVLQNPRTPYAAASAAPLAAQSKGRTLDRTVRNLERRVERLKRSSQRVERISERFDEWESCVSWVPVTEYGDPEGKFGYLYGGKDGTEPGFKPALAIDRSDWDDPDYMFLAFVGSDRPGRECQNEPGEAVD